MAIDVVGRNMHARSNSDKLFRQSVRKYVNFLPRMKIITNGSHKKNHLWAVLETTILCDTCRYHFLEFDAQEKVVCVFVFVRKGE